MKLNALLCSALLLSLFSLSELSICSLARHQIVLSPLAAAARHGTITLVSTHKSLLQGNKKTLEDNPKKSLKRTSHQKPLRLEKKGRLLVVDEIDYVGPRTHPPTKPPRR
ncbi:hypothetical protein GOP47_0028092 [Adiantum capillus-veneris]|nr:hypothetical protein GOP47_0028092 [Adiantum capillus-veneris]